MKIFALFVFILSYVNSSNGDRNNSETDLLREELKKHLGAIKDSKKSQTFKLTDTILEDELIEGAYINSIRENQIRTKNERGTIKKNTKSKSTVTKNGVCQTQIISGDVGSLNEINMNGELNDIKYGMDPLKNEYNIDGIPPQINQISNDIDHITKNKEMFKKFVQHNKNNRNKSKVRTMTNIDSRVKQSLKKPNLKDNEYMEFSYYAGDKAPLESNEPKDGCKFSRNYHPYERRALNKPIYKMQTRPNNNWHNNQWNPRNKPVEYGSDYSQNIGYGISPSNKIPFKTSFFDKNNRNRPVSLNDLELSVLSNSDQVNAKNIKSPFRTDLNNSMIKSRINDTFGIYLHASNKFEVPDNDVVKSGAFEISKDNKDAPESGNSKDPHSDKNGNQADILIKEECAEIQQNKMGWREYLRSKMCCCFRRNNANPTI